MALNKELAATALLEAAYTTDEMVCERYGISRRSLQRWRKALGTDNELAQSVATKKAAMDVAWAESLPAALRNSLEFIAGACAKAKDDPTAYRNPLLISAVAGALKLCAEVFYTGRVLDARLARLTDGFVDCSDPKGHGLVN